MEGVDLPRGAVHAENLSFAEAETAYTSHNSGADDGVAGLFDIAGTYSLDLGPLEFDSINGVLAVLGATNAPAIEAISLELNSAEALDAGGLQHTLTVGGALENLGTLNVINVIVWTRQ